VSVTPYLAICNTVPETSVRSFVLLEQTLSYHTPRATTNRQFLMSTIKFSYPTYKLFEVSVADYLCWVTAESSGCWSMTNSILRTQPQYHSQRPIIIDAESIESPETVTLRYEEEAAARANGGDLRGDTPPGLLSIDECAKPQPPPMHCKSSITVSRTMR
jgi:hypothetical protein